HQERNHRACALGLWTASVATLSRRPSHGRQGTRRPGERGIAVVPQRCVAAGAATRSKTGTGEDQRLLRAARKAWRTFDEDGSRSSRSLVRVDQPSATDDLDGPGLVAGG